MKLVVDEQRVLKTLSKLDRCIRAAYSAWEWIVISNGIEGLRNVKGFHFEKLKGKRKGQYSCRLNKGYRVFFKKVVNTIIIEVLEISKHAY